MGHLIVGLFWSDIGYCSNQNKFCRKILNYNTIRLGLYVMYVCPNVHMYICLYVRQTVICINC